MVLSLVFINKEKWWQSCKYLFCRSERSRQKSGSFCKQIKHSYIFEHFPGPARVCVWKWIYIESIVVLSCDERSIKELSQCLAKECSVVDAHNLKVELANWTLLLLIMPFGEIIKKQKTVSIAPSTLHVFRFWPIHCFSKTHYLEVGAISSNDQNTLIQGCTQVVVEMSLLT